MSTQTTTSAASPVAPQHVFAEQTPNPNNLRQNNLGQNSALLQNPDVLGRIAEWVATGDTDIKAGKYAANFNKVCVSTNLANRNPVIQQTIEDGKNAIAAQKTSAAQKASLAAYQAFMFSRDRAHLKFT